MKDILDTIPSAGEAASKRREIEDRQLKAEAGRVAAAIKLAVDSGKSEVGVDPIMGLALIAHLREKGYTLRQRQTGPNENETQISW